MSYTARPYSRTVLSYVHTPHYKPKDDLNKYLLEFVSDAVLRDCCRPQVPTSICTCHLMVMLTRETERCHKSSGNIILAFLLFAALHARSFSLDGNKEPLFAPCGFMFVK